MEKAFKKVTGLSLSEGIRKAIEGGYSRKHGSFSLPVKLNDDFDIWEYDINAICIDPLFWKSLGVAMGWEAETCKRCGREKKSENFGDYCYCTDPDTTPNTPPDFTDTWKYKMHSFIDAIIEEEV